MSTCENPCVCGSPSSRFRAQVRRYFWRNYLAHNIEGGLFMGGMAFLAGDSVMPRMVQSLGGPDWVISLMPTLMFLGFTGPPLLTAHLIERMDRLKPVILLSGFAQRLPFLVAGLVLWFMAASHPLLALLLVVGAPFISGLLGGCTLPAWLELVARTIPENRLSSLFAIRFIITAVIGLCAGGIIESVLRDLPGPRGYAVLHFYATGFVVLSYLVFMMVRETSVSELRREVPARTLRQNLGSLPNLLRSDSRFRNFLNARLLATGLFVTTPFLAIHVLERTGKPESFLGYLVQAQMLGAFVGNLLGGWLGDRCGGKLPALLGNVVLTITLLAASLEPVTWSGIAIFFALGLGMYLNRIGLSALMIEISPPERRPTYTAVTATAGFIGMLGAALLCWLLRLASGAFWPTAVAGGVTLALSTLFLARVNEPRRVAGR